ncbi:MAG: tetratricopeptide repeat protein [Steroidobacteraceae bacterium]
MRPNFATVAATFGIAAMTASMVQAADASTVQQRATNAYLRGDASALQSLASEAAAWRESGNRDERYAAAYVQFRRAQLAVAAGNKKQLREAGDRCVAASEAAIQADNQYAEAHALQAACYGYLATLGGFGAISSGRKSGKAMDAAIAIAPANPRVILVDGIGLGFRPRIAGGDKAKAYQRSREAAAAFGSGHKSTTNGPDWGAPEAWYWVGRGAEDAGDFAAARKAYEQALALASDFAAARKRLATLAN